MSEPTEASIRFAIGLAWREGDYDGVLSYYRRFPLDSFERSVAIEEAQKLIFADEQSV